MIWYSPRNIHIPVMSQLKSWLGNSTFNTDLLMDNWLIYLYTIVYLSFAVHKLEKFSSYSGEVHFEGLVKLLIEIR